MGARQSGWCLRVVTGPLFVSALWTLVGYAEDVPKGRPHPSIERAAVATLRQAYGRDRNTARLRRFPIGVFDSGTGGLTVLEQILTLDCFDNDTHALQAGGDGKLDFAKESFIFLADQANMPYGNYPIVGKEAVLDDLILKDAQFLFGTRYHASKSGEETRNDKLPVKAIVIACNTATAYGKPDIQRVLRQADLDIKVIGVIDAGAEGAVEVLADGKPGTIGVVPTRGTVLSGAYPVAIRRAAKAKGLKHEIPIVQQGALGLAGAIDGAPAFILRNATGSRPRKEYRGPSLANPTARIEVTILPRYDFDFSEGAMLFEGSPEKPTQLQLNSVENYIAYHLVTLLENVRRLPSPQPLRVIVMGCTHFPFYADAFRAELRRLYEYQEDGEHVYRPYMVKEVRLIDPACFTAQKLYRSLAQDGRLFPFKDKRGQETRGEFYISIPCPRCAGVKLSENGWFTYDYKYGRSPGQVKSDFHTVPFRSEHLGPEVEERLRGRVPAVWKLIEGFRADSPKLRRARPEAGR